MLITAAIRWVFIAFVLVAPLLADKPVAPPAPAPAEVGGELGEGPGTLDGLSPEGTEDAAEGDAEQGADTEVPAEVERGGEGEAPADVEKGADAEAPAEIEKGADAEVPAEVPGAESHGGEPVADNEEALLPQEEITVDVDEVLPIVLERERGYFSGAWPIEQGWDRQAELDFAEFVKAVGLAREKRGFTFEQAVRSERVNPLWTEEDKDFRVLVDCATFPYLVRAYFAFKTRRPFAWHSNKGRRYGKTNKPRRYSDWSMFATPEEFFRKLDSTVSSAHFRMRADLEGTDTYPVDVTAESLIPGTVYYDPNGHVLLVYDVDSYSGDVLFLDAHPDGTMTIREFGKRYAVGGARFGGGFRAWRHYRAEVLDEETGSFRLTLDRNEDSDFYSGEAQYRWDYLVDEHALDYWEWVRSRVSTNGIYFYPEEDFNLLLDEVCAQIQSRVDSVKIALEAEMHLRKHPNKLPYNIYGAIGDWETYSSPGRDVRIRATFREAFAYVIKTMELTGEGSSRIKYDVEPWELYKEYAKIWHDHSQNTLCQYEYTNSAGESVKLTLEDIADRLFDLSFDPYHCPELRWGARPNSRSKAARREFKTCPVDPRKYKWYEEETRLRNRISRLIGKGTMTHRGPSTAPDINVPRLLKCYDEKLPEWEKCHTRGRIKASGIGSEE
jgi:hypothetical protein